MFVEPRLKIQTPIATHTNNKCTMQQYANALQLLSAAELAKARQTPKDFQALLDKLSGINQAVFRISAVQCALAERTAFGVEGWTVQWGTPQLRRPLNVDERSQAVLPGFESLDEAIEAFLNKVRTFFFLWLLGLRWHVPPPPALIRHCFSPGRHWRGHWRR